MQYPQFFDTIDKIVLYDDLSRFLGVNDGILDFSYADIVKSAGHSCATVAGAYLMALKGLKSLYGAELPQRGYIKVELAKEPTVENTGAVGCVLSNITGATTDYGFGGIPTGKYNRRNTLFYGVAMDADVCFTRLDTNEKVYVTYTPQKVVNPMAILKSAIMPNAKEEDIKSFPQRFQEMVKTVFEHKDEVITITKKDI
ncbi:hypothetical protein [Sulfurimonas sp. NWX367]|uniref:hypothetical protein n=1 Tax=Sulfurimonas sp. NWX367 TaxID=2925413 RepID=UPI003204BD15